jgi:transcriptional regulator with XRE-family HTH domain
MSEFTESFAADMRAARLNASLSQEKLAAMAGVSIDTIGNIERGDTEPSVDALVGIARALKLDVQKLIAKKVADGAEKSVSRRRNEAEAAVVAGDLPDKTLAVWLEIGRLLEKRGV